MTKEQTIVEMVTKLAIPDILIDRASVALMCREGSKPEVLKRLTDGVRAQWKRAGPEELEALVNACLMRASLIVTSRVPLAASASQTI
jgi:hypothetical protein